MDKIKAGLLVGTRPEIIKLSPLIKRIYADETFEPVFIHSGQHYDEGMSGLFLEELGLQQPGYNLEVGSGTHAEQLAKALVETEKILRKEKPELFIVHGDTNTTLAGALAAVKLGIPVAHVEAGLRSFDRSMPEEINRTLVDHCSDLLFAQSAASMENLKREGIPDEKSFLTGNTIVEACVENLEVAKQKSDIVEKLGIGEYGLVTFHRAENTNKERLGKFLNAIGKIDCKLVFPIHPRTKKEMGEFSLALPENVSETEPVGYFDFLLLLANSAFVLTDSGGIQEEAIALHIPCLTARYNTERPETVDAGANILVGVDEDKIVENANRILKDAKFRENMRDVENPYGDGKASDRIVKIIKESRE